MKERGRVCERERERERKGEGKREKERYRGGGAGRKKESLFVARQNGNPSYAHHLLLLYPMKMESDQKRMY